MKRKLASLISAFLALVIAGSVLVSAEVPETLDGSEPSEPSEPSVSAWDGAATREPSGNGTEEDPFRIGCAEEFAYLNQLMTDQNKTYFTDQYFILTSDIDCNGKQLRIGTSSKRFGGVFDGNGHCVYNNRIAVKASPTGLFASANGAVIKNLNIDTSSVSTDYASANEKGTAGMLVGFLEKSTLTGCTVRANCTVQASCYVGGLVGKAKDSVISDCINQSTVQTVSSETAQKLCVNYCVGGVLGYSQGGGNTISNCINYGTVQMEIATADSTSKTFIFGVGGIVGYLGTSDSLSHCCNYGNVSSKESFGQRISVGGIAGRCRTGEMTVEQCYYADGELTVDGSSNTHVGLIIGFVNANTTVQMKNCAAVSYGEVSLSGGAASEKNLIEDGNRQVSGEEIREKTEGIRDHIWRNRVSLPALVGFQETAPDENGCFRVRFLLGIDGLNYDSVQIQVTAEWTDAQGQKQVLIFGEEDIRTVYSGILADNILIDPLEYGNAYFAICTSEELPANAEIQFTVRSFLTGMEETEPTELPAVEILLGGEASAEEP